MKKRKAILKRSKTGKEKSKSIKHVPPTNMFQIQSLQKDLKRTVDRMLEIKQENAALVHENAAGLELLKKLKADKEEYETKYNNLTIEHAML